MTSTLEFDRLQHALAAAGLTALQITPGTPGVA